MRIATSSIRPGRCALRLPDFPSSTLRRGCERNRALQDQRLILPQTPRRVRHLLGVWTNMGVHESCRLLFFFLLRIWFEWNSSRCSDFEIRSRSKLAPELISQTLSCAGVSVLCGLTACVPYIDPSFLCLFHSFSPSDVRLYSFVVVRASRGEISCPSVIVMQPKAFHLDSTNASGNNTFNQKTKIRVSSQDSFPVV